MAFEILRSATIPNQAGSIVSVENDRAGAAVKGAWRVNGGRSYTTRLKVQTNSQYVGPIQVIQSVAPVWGAYYRWPLTELGGSFTLPTLPVEQDTGSFLQSITADPDGDDGKQWILTLEYTPFDVQHELGEANDNGVTDPVAKPLEVSWGTAKYERSKPVDESDPPKPYLNTAGDPLEDPPKSEESRPVLTIVRNEAIYDEALVQAYVDHINKDSFLGYPPNTVKCKDITAKRDFSPDWGYYWPVTYEFEFRADTNGWTEEVLSAGYRERVGGTSDPTPVMIGGFTPSAPVQLQQNGSYLPLGDPYFMQFKLFPEADFKALGFPDDLFTQAI